MLLDTETTGLQGHCLQLAYRHYQEERLIEEFNELFLPPVDIEEGAQKVHGISIDMLKDKPFIGTLNPEFQEKLNKTIVVAHNAEFDVSILQRDGFKIPFHICTCKLARHFFPFLPNHKLQYLRTELDLEVDENKVNAKAHDAMGDVLILEELFFKLLEMAVERRKQATPKEIFAELINISRQSRW